MKKIKLSLVLMVFLLSLTSVIAANDAICTVYITGVGCPACAQEDPIILDELLKEEPNFVVVEYEIYKEQENGQMVMEYDSNYNSGFHIPLIIFGKEDFSVGVGPVRRHAREAIEKGSNYCPLPDGSSVAFDGLDLTSLPAKPKIWRGERILIKTEERGNNALLRELLITENLSAALEGINFVIIKSSAIAISGRSIYFDNAIELDGWIFQWNGESIGAITPAEEEEPVQPQEFEQRDGLGFYKVFIIALADTVNPCALAVFILFLIGVMSYDPKRGKKILSIGAAFVTAVYICYFTYGLIIVKFWQVVQALTTVRLALYTILGAVAIVLGVLNLKDFFWYKPGGFAREMPIGWRGKVKKMMLGITSIKGAFVMGAFVTIFLMPCTMGPYLIATGILSTLDLIKVIPWLLVYNLIFILPLYGIVLGVYFGLKKVEDVSGWKERNIRKLHLVVGLIMLFIGVAIIFGWI
ncbi:MAG: hypothetical protein KAU20_00865 [Nanoarchaeota archaeon]|nr:hypothetical protein [Nanoarchaeota archaeon]